jgi:segregation and condensation protein B
MPVAVRELELDLDAFEGPFDLLLSLVLREELPLREIDLAAIIVTFVEHLAEKGELDLDACGEFLILISALLELKARAMFPEEDAELAELEPEEAAEELARRLAEYRRAKEAAQFLRERLDVRRDLHFRLGPAPLAPVVERKLAPQAPEQLAAALRALAVEPPEPSVAHMALRFPPVALRLRPGGERALARRGRGRVPGPPRAAQAERDRDRAGRAVRPDKDFPCRRRKEPLLEHGLRLITTDATPALELARTLEALLVVASQPLSVDDLAAAAETDPSQVEESLSILEQRFSEERSGIVLEHVAGGWAFRASKTASEACARLFEKPAERGLSQAALETLAIVAYLGPVSRPEITRIRGVNVDGVVAGLVERGLVAEGGRDNEFGAIRYRTTPLFERIFGLESLAALPRVDDLGADVDEIRGRLEAVAEKRPA